MKKLFVALVSLSVLVVGIFPLIWKYPIRFPPVQFESSPIALVFEDSTDQLIIQGHGAYFQKQEDGVILYRAFAPEPVLKLQIKPGKHNVKISNIHPTAVLQTNSNEITEVHDNLTRYVSIKYDGQETVNLRWQYPQPDHYKFAAIGDSGENDELVWVIKRAQQLGVHFFLHLGDIYYNGNYHQAAKILNNAPFPVYVALGNHDYLFEDGKPYSFFRKDLGPRNSAFSLGGVQFLNIDTAADTLPWFGGERGKMLRDAPRVDANGQPFKAVIAFTHRPIGLQGESDHVVNRFLEADWLSDQLLSRRANSLLAGHIHDSITRTYRGINIYVAGDGLGSRNLIGGRPLAKMLIGEIKEGQLTLSWHPLNMPLDVQCSLRNRWIWEDEKNMNSFNREAMLTARNVCLSKEK